MSLGISGIFRDNAPTGSLRAYTHVRRDATGTFYSFLSGRWYDEFLRLYSRELFADRAVSFCEAPGMYSPLALEFRPPCETAEVTNELADRLLKHAGDIFEDTGARCLVLSSPNATSTRFVVPGVRAAKFLQRLVADRVNADPRVLSITGARGAPVGPTEAFMYGSGDGRRDPMRVIAVLVATGPSGVPGREFALKRFPLDCALEPHGVRRSMPLLAALLRSADAAAARECPYADAPGEGQADAMAAADEERVPGARDALTQDILFVVTSLSSAGPAERSEIRADVTHEVRKAKRESLREQGKLTAYEDVIGPAGRNCSPSSLPVDATERQNGVDYARKLMLCLSDERADDFGEWLRVGHCLRNIDDNLLATWVEFSKRSSKFTKGECERLWRKFRACSGTNLMSLRRMAYEDNREQFVKLDDNDLWKAVKMFIDSNLEFDAAVVLHKLLGETHRFDGKRWWAFSEHRWVKDVRAARFKRTFTGTVHREIQKVIEMHGDDGDSIGSWVTLTKTSRGRDRLVTVAQDIFQDDGFCERLDQNGSLLVLRNGVYDLGRREFRDGRPEDMVSMSSPERTYRPLSDYDAQEIEEVMGPIRKMIPSQDVREFLLRKLALMLNGAVHDPKICFFVGRGSNGKSVLVQLLKTTLGDYFGKVNTSLITQKRAASSSASPETAATEGKRLVVCDEPSERDGPINVGIVKEITGRDTILARALYSEPKMFLPQFTLIVLCNKIPTIPSADWGTLRRLQMVEWKAQFKEDPDPSKPFEFKADPDIEEKLRNGADVFLSLLVDYHNRAAGTGNPEPAEVSALTESYRRDANRIRQYVEAAIERKEGGALVLKDAYREFRMFAEETGMSHTETLDTFRRSLADALDAEPEQKRGGKYVWADFSLRNF